MTSEQGGSGDKDGRQLTAAGSNPAEPPKKFGRVGGKDGGEEDVPGMFKQLMDKMNSVEGKLGGLQRAVGEVQALAGRAVETAEGAAKAVADLREDVKGEVGRMDGSIVNAVTAAEEAKEQLSALQLEVTKMKKRV